MTKETQTDKMSSLRQLLSVISAILAVIGFGWQVSEPWMTYFRYETKSSLDLMPYRTIDHVPVIAICQRFDEVNVTVEDAFKEIDPKDDWTMTYIMIIANRSLYETTDKKTIDKIFSMDKFVKYHRYCLSVKTDLLDLDDIFMDILFILSFSMGSFNKSGKDSYVSIYLTSREDQFFGPFGGTIFVLVKDEPGTVLGGEVTVTYSLIERILLKNPFDTNCIDYSKSSIFSSRSECIEDCIQKETLRLTKMMSMETFISRTDQSNRDVIRMTSKHLKADFSLWYLTKKISRDCHKVCIRNDCRKKIFRPINLNDSPFPVNNSRKGKIFLDFRRPTDFIMTITYHPSFKLMDILLFTTSCLGFWFGLCPLTIGETFFKKKGRRLRRRRRLPLRNGH